MKKNTSKQKKNYISIKRLFFFLTVFTVNFMNGQLQNNGSFYVADNSFLFVGSTIYNFGMGQSVTSRTSSNYGKIVFADGFSTSGESDSHFLDGYVTTMTTSPFLLPVGQFGVYAPAKIVSSTNAPVDAAYYRQSAVTVGSTLSSSVNVLSDTEYWEIKGPTSSILSLTWRPSSVLGDVVSNLSDLTIAGYDGTQWVSIPSVVDGTSILGGSSSMASGSITSSASVDLSTYTYFTLAYKNLFLGNDDFDVTTNCTAFISNQVFSVTSGASMKNVEIYDITGRKIFESKIQNALNFTAPFNHSQAVYIARIDFENGKTLSVKLINTNNN